MLAAGDVNYSELKNVCIWNKNNAGMGTFYRSKHEMVFIWKNGSTRHLNNFELGQYGRHRTNVWDCRQRLDPGDTIQLCLTLVETKSSVPGHEEQ